MKQILRWLFGRNSIIAKVLRIIFSSKIEVEVCADSGLLPNLHYCPSIEKRKFWKGYEPQKICDIHGEWDYMWVEICVDSERLATAYCPNTRAREYHKDHVPTQVCHIHQPEPQPKLDPAIEFPRIRRQFSAFFPKCGLINSVEYPESAFFDFIDRVARENLSNVLRFFPFGVWRPGDLTRQLVLSPHPGSIEDGFSIGAIDQSWKDQVRRRLAYVRNAGIIPDIVLHDNCQYHEPDPWEYHWLYRENNRGFHGLPTHWNSEVKCHFWQYSYIDRGFWQNYYPGISSESELNDEDYQDMLGCRGTENYYLWFDVWFIENVLKPELGNDFRISHNEQCCAFGYHDFLFKNVYQPQGIPQDRLYTSFDAHEFDNGILRAEWYWAYRNNIFNHYMPDVHKINTFEKYEDAKKLKTYDDGQEYYLVIPDRKVLISTDGTGRWPEVDRLGSVIDWRHGELERLVSAIYADGNDFERIEWLPDNCNFAELDWIGAGKMRDKVLPYLG